MNTEPPDDAPLEALLRNLPQPALPPAWRAPILKAARPPAWPGLSRPVKWGLAAAWAAIGLLHLTSPPGLPPASDHAGAPPRPRDLTTEQWLAAMEFHQPSHR
jgi:hypothetical protein